MNLRRILAAPLVAAAVTTTLIAPAHAASTSFSVSAVVAGEKSRAAGHVKKIGTKRTVVLQRKAGRTWRTVARSRSTTSGRFAITFTAPTVTTTYRVHAPRVGRKKSSTTRTRVFRPVRQAVALSLPTGARLRSSTVAGLTFSPVRAGRPYTVERLDGTTWRQVATGTQPRSGRASVTVPTGERGTTSYRLTAGAWRGAAAVRSSTRTTLVGGPELVSATPEGGPANEFSKGSAASHDGRYVVIESPADSLGVPNSPKRMAIWVRDRVENTTTLVSRTPDGAVPDASSFRSDMSDDGRWIVFASSARNLAPGANGSSQIYLADRTTGVVTRLSVTSGGASAGSGDSTDPAISPNGRFVTFTTRAENLVLGSHLRSQVVRIDRETGRQVLVSRNLDDQPGNGASWGAVPDDSSRVAYQSEADDLVATDENTTSDVFVYDADANYARNLTDRGSIGNPVTGHLDMSADGRVAFSSRSRLTDDAPEVERSVYVYDWADDSLRHVAPTNSGSEVEITPDGRRVSHGRSVVDLETGRSTVLGAEHPGRPPVHDVILGALSGDGRWIFYMTASAQLIGQPRIGGYEVMAEPLP
ncbi:MAG: hypothetical protein PGN07_02240 [Aeromicrobium erythreum]